MPFTGAASKERASPPAGCTLIWRLVSSSIRHWTRLMVNRRGERAQVRIKSRTQYLISPPGSPLGELFDHGMDCIANAFFLPGMMMTMRAGLTPDKFNVLSFLCHFVFFCSHWVHYVTGKLTFGLIDITEIQVTFDFALSNKNLFFSVQQSASLSSRAFSDPNTGVSPCPFLRGTFNATWSWLARVLFVSTDYHAWRFS